MKLKIISGAIAIDVWEQADQLRRLTGLSIDELLDEAFRGWIAHGPGSTRSITEVTLKHIYLTTGRALSLMEAIKKQQLGRADLAYTLPLFDDILQKNSGLTSSVLSQLEAEWTGSAASDVARMKREAQELIEQLKQI